MTQTTLLTLRGLGISNLLDILWSRYWLKIREMGWLWHQLLVYIRSSSSLLLAALIHRWACSKKWLPITFGISMRKLHSFCVITHEVNQSKILLFIQWRVCLTNKSGILSLWSYSYIISFLEHQISSRDFLTPFWNHLYWSAFQSSKIIKSVINGHLIYNDMQTRS